MNNFLLTDPFGFALMILAGIILALVIEFGWSWIRRRLSLRSTGGKWVWAIALQFEECGCKHVDFVFGLFILRWDFGRHKEQ